MLTYLINFGVLIIALLHFWFLVLEAFLWQKPIGLKIFHLQADFAQKSAVLAANQGLYNAFLAVGLIWSLAAQDPIESLHNKFFFLSCVSIAGTVGALTLNNKKVFFIQALPALIVLLLLFIQ